MLTSSIVLTLSALPSALGDLLQTLRLDPRVVLGPAEGRFLPLVLQTDDTNEAEALIETWAGLTAVLHIDLVAATLDEAFDDEVVEEDLHASRGSH